MDTFRFLAGFVLIVVCLAVMLAAFFDDDPMDLL